MIVGGILLVLVLMLLFAVVAPTIAYVAAFPWALKKSAAYGSTPLMIAMAAYPLLYFGAWGVSYAQSRLRSTTFDKEMASVKLAPFPTDLPSTLLVRGRTTDLPALGCVGTIIFDENKGWANAPDWQSAHMALPRRHLLFISGAYSQFDRAGFYGTARNTPYELRLVDGSTSTLIALDNPNPIVHPRPLLTLSGWYRPKPKVYVNTVTADLKAFFQPVIAHCNTH